MGFADSVKETAWERTRAVSSEITLGRPLGGCRSTMSPALARGLYICTVALLTIATVLALAVPAWAVDVNVDTGYDGKLHWAAVVNDINGSGQTEIWWVLEDAGGNWVESITQDGTTSHGSSSRPSSQPQKGFWVKTSVTNVSDIASNNWGPYAPDINATRNMIGEKAAGYVNLSAADITAIANGVKNDKAEINAKGDAFSWDSPIESTDVTVDLAHLDHILPSFLKNIYQFILAPLIKLAAGLCQWLLKLVDPSKMVDGNFSGGTYKDLYATAVKINDNVAVPYAKTFIMIVFLVSLLDPGRPRSHDGTPEFIDGFLRRVALLFLAWVFVENALTIVEFIYWLGGNAVTKIVELLGGASGFTEMGTAIQSSVDSTLSSVKFSEYYIVLFLLLVMFAVLMSVFKCVQKIIVVMLLRAGEIYLRASMAALPFAFFAGERQRMVGMNYMKRFLAVCFQAVVIVVALSFMGVIFTTSSTIISGLIGQASESVPGMTAAATVAQAVLPTVVSVACATAIVDKSDAVANSMFGM